MPATSGVEALVPPTTVIVCAGDAGHSCTPDEQTITYPGAGSANAAMSGTGRLPLCDAVCHHGRFSVVLTPPPPPAMVWNGGGNSSSFHTPEEAIWLSDPSE